MYCVDVDVISGSILMEELTTVGYNKANKAAKEKMSEVKLVSVVEP